MITGCIAHVLPLAEAAARSGRWQEARRILRAVQEELHSEPQALYLLAEAHSRLSEPEAARIAARYALEGFGERGDPQGLLRAENLLGVILFEAGELDEARAHFRNALRLAMEEGALQMRANIANNLGTICDLRGEREQALEYFHMALRSYYEAGDLKGQAQTSHNLGIAHKELEQREVSEGFFAQAAELALAAGADALFAFSVMARAELVLEAGDPDDAEQLVRQALPRFDTASSLYGLTEVHRLRGLIAWRRGDVAQAQAHLDAAMDFSDLHGVPLLDAEVRVERGHLLCLLGETEGGLEDLRRAAEAFEGLQSRRRAERARTLLRTFSAPGAAASAHVA
jgi:tetratricopeptide (TPR) repeat protein